LWFHTATNCFSGGEKDHPSCLATAISLASKPRTSRAQHDWLRPLFSIPFLAGRATVPDDAQQAIEKHAIAH
jgi:hypothetical protein